jgi:hypothetical protein
MDVYFLHHVHEVYVPPGVEPARVARLWVTGGDDPTGVKSGVLCFESLDDDGGLSGARWVFRETPGYRLVGLHGNGKHVFVGNESAPKVIKIQTTRESRPETEYALGNNVTTTSSTRCHYDDSSCWAPALLSTGRPSAPTGRYPT